MRSKVQFFMFEQDEVEFINTFLAFTNGMDKASETQYFFLVGDCTIQLLRSKLEGNQLTSGSISIATHGFGLTFKAAKEAEKIYSKMRQWLKKNYHNNLTVENSTIENSQQAINYFWASQRVLEGSKNLILRQIPNAPVIFKILE